MNDGLPIETDKQRQNVVALGIERKMSEEVLLAQFKNFTTIFDSLNALVYVADLQTYELLYINPYGADLFGAHGVGRPCFRVLQSGQAGRCAFCTNDLLIRNGIPQPPYVWEFRNTVTGRWFQCIDRAIHWSDGRLVRMEIAMDITERKRVEEERERLLEEVRRQSAELDVTITSVADGLMIHGRTEEIIRMNPAAEEMLGYTPEERKLPLAERMALLRAETPDGEPFPIEDTPSRRALRGETVQGVLMVLHPPRTDRTIWVSNSAAPLRAPDGTVLGAVSVCTDVTQLHRLEEQRKDLIRTVSHDLRNPLAIIHAHARFLIRNLEKAGWKGNELSSAEAIVTGAQRMEGIIRDLVYATLLEDGQVRLENRPVALSYFLSDLLQRSSSAMEVGRVKVEVPADLPPVSVDPNYLERVFMNLLSNALKYSPDDAEIRIGACRSDGEMVISVSDRGRGIGQQDVRRIFERYYRAEGAGSAEGIGLGLYITRMLVEAQGGRIWVESELGKGSTFYFSQPLA